jgi:hypothetical protein
MQFCSALVRVVNVVSSVVTRNLSVSGIKPQDIVDMMCDDMPWEMG